MFDGEIRSASAVAQEDTKVFTLSRKEFISLVRDFSEISIQLLTDIAERIRKSDQHITSLTLNSSERRIGLCILRLAEEQGTIKDGTVTIKKFPFQRDIANIVGTSRETVNHILSRFEIDNLINRDGRHLTIKNYTKFFQRFD